MASPSREPGALPRTHVPRPRLLEKLAEAVQRRLTIVCANAGYGKTTLLAEYARSAGLRAEFLYLSPADRDIAWLADGVEAALRRLNVGREAKATRQPQARMTYAPSVAVLSERLLRRASRLRPDPALLILDDYHNVDGIADINALVVNLVEGSPPSIHFVILSRTAPRLPVSQLRARQEVSLLTEADLAFTLGETCEFLSKVSGLDPADPAIALVQERTEGWAAGIAMVSQLLSYGGPEKVLTILVDPVASAWLVYDYLAEQVFDKQEPAVQDFLVKTSVLSRLTAPACDFVLESTSSRATLLALEERGLFTASIDPARESFRYHQLFLEFLRQKLYQRESRVSVEALHLRAAQWHESQEDWDECVHHYLKAGAWELAARVVERTGTRQIFSGHSQTVEHWLRALPETVTASRPWMLCLRARLSQMSGKREEALSLLERAFLLFQAGNDREGMAFAEGEIAYVEFRSGRLRDSIRHFASAIARVEAPGALKSELLVMQAMACVDAGMLDEAVRSCEASAEGLATVEDEFKRWWGRSRSSRHIALVHMEMGDLEAALRIAREAHEFCVDRQIGEHEESWTLSSLGAVLWASGELYEAIRTFERALSLSSRYTANEAQFISLWYGNSLRDIGRYEDAAASYSRGGLASDVENMFMSIVTRDGRATRTAVTDLYRRACRSESLPLRTAVEVVVAAALRDEREGAKALEHLREAARLLRQHGYRLRLASALLHQARLEYEFQRPREGRETLAEALRLAEEGDCFHFFWWDQELVAGLCQRALVEGICTDYVSRLAVRRLNSLGGAVFAPLLQDHRPDVRQRAAEIISSLPRREATNLREELLAECADGAIRRSLLRAIGDEVISAEGIRALRRTYGLSWREIEILVEYYLKPASEPIQSSARLRTECAQRLNISEHTVRCHVNNLRSKLALPAWMSGKRVLDWAKQEGLLP